MQKEPMEAEERGKEVQAAEEAEAASCLSREILLLMPRTETLIFNRDLEDNQVMEDLKQAELAEEEERTYLHQQIICL